MAKRILLAIMILVFISPIVTASYGNTFDEDLGVKIYNKYHRSVGKVIQIWHIFTGTKVVYTEAGSGTGFFVNEDGLMVTNCHVVAKPAFVQVMTIFGVFVFPVVDSSFIYVNDKGIEYQANFVSKCRYADLAEIKVDIDKKDFDVVEFGNSNDIKEGQWVFIMGCPLGEKMGITFGIVSCLNNDLGGISPKGMLVRTDAAANPGNSGSIIINSKGKVIAVLNSGIMEAHGMAYGIPINLYLIPHFFWQTLNN